MFFEIHNEKRIGYKALTNADLGRATASHQTHIGLFDDVLTFLPNNIEIDDALFIYDNVCTPLYMRFGRIHRKNGDFNSPKINTGGRDVISIVLKIKEIASQSPNISNWYLFWFGLQSEQPVFFMFHNKSQTYMDITNMKINLPHNVKNRLTEADIGFNAIMVYLENIVNTSGENIIRELEITSQIDDTPQGSKLRPHDIEKAKNNFCRIGKEGENLINEWLNKLKTQCEIDSYTWFNKDRESGLPYDFSIQESSGNVIFLDVKSTSLGFDQQMIFSGKELQFIHQSQNDYHVYRIYDIDNDEKHLKICKDYKQYASKLNSKVNNFMNDMKTIQANLQTIKIAVPPINCYTIFENEIILT